ncbi:MAG: formylglycine-generating enzyme family protein [Anaerolineae bacterium]|nr:formylglycine-generating enzyme family protein [Anaerolineae bacterium]
MLGSDSSRTSEASDNEQPQHTVHLPSYYIARYPITCVQYQAFVDSGGYQDRRYWTSVSWKWKNEEEIDGPLYLKDSFWSVTNHPVVGVSWYEACAFTRWFTESAGVEIRLPTEPEWEKAARGTDGRQYPWGDAFSEGYANVRVEKPGYSIMRSSTVGIYPQGQSPFGVYDMCGNVLEWCFNESGISYPYSESSDINSDKHRAARGGSWSTNANLARAAVRCIRQDFI